MMKVFLAMSAIALSASNSAKGNNNVSPTEQAESTSIQNTNVTLRPALHFRLSNSEHSTSSELPRQPRTKITPSTMRAREHKFCWLLRLIVATTVRSHLPIPSRPIVSLSDLPPPSPAVQSTRQQNPGKVFLPRGPGTPLQMPLLGRSNGPSLQLPLLGRSNGPSLQLPLLGRSVPHIPQARAMGPFS